MSANKKIKMGNDELILYIRKNYENCSLPNDEIHGLGVAIWRWLQENAHGKKTVEAQVTFWPQKGKHIAQNKLPYHATQFEFDRDKLPDLYDYLDELGKRS